VPEIYLFLKGKTPNKNMVHGLHEECYAQTLGHTLLTLPQLLVHVAILHILATGNRFHFKLEVFILFL
jgi:hypothetical protein